MADYDGNTALIVVDMQNDFADPGGSLSVSGGDSLVGPVNAEIIRAASAGALVVYTQDWHPESTPHFEKDGGIWPVHCVIGTWGAEFHPRLLIAGPTVHKGSNGEDGFSGFTMRDPMTGETIPTEMAGLLRSRGIDRVVVCGLALDYCVKATALDSLEHGWATAVPPELTAAVNLQPGDGTQARKELEAAGATTGY
jgi:nicotinamidase/pyrazinamidase